MRPPAATLAGLLALFAWAGPARAVMDVEDRGPQLNAGRYAFRPTNIGVLGNAFFNVGRSFDPSFEYPRGSGIELLNHAELWVGALDADGQPRVSGGPMLEWRPTLDPADRVRVAWRGRPGSRRGVDDDGDGRIDEERLNGKDDDGDGLVDEDIGVPADGMAASEYRDDQPEAVSYVYPNGEAHRPLGLDEYEEDYCWALPGWDGVMGVQYTITNHGDRTLHDVYVGLLADLDVRRRDDPLGHLNDVASSTSMSVTAGRDLALDRQCPTVQTVQVPVVADGAPGSTMPVVAVVGLGHTIDPLADFRETARYARAPGYSQFRYSLFRQDLPPGQGGVPVLDGGRYAALAGDYAENPSPQTPGDQVVLLRCGPFATLAPGQSLELALAMCAAPAADSMARVLRRAGTLYAGIWQDRLRDSTNTDWRIGATGLNGHEVCLEMPPGPSLWLDPDCAECKIALDGSVPEASPKLYQHGRCIWTNADCDFWTGRGGFETQVHWLDPGAIPTGPAYHVHAQDHRVAIAWDNEPEVLLKARMIATGYTFSGYRIYRLADWRDRRSQLPPLERWQMIASYGPDSLDRQRPLALVTDSSVVSDTLQYGQIHYPIGRYRYVDDQVLNGFDYIYLVTSLVSRQLVDGLGNPLAVERIESPLVTRLDSVVVPHVIPAERAGTVWVVPNPYRGGAAWDRPSVPGDVFGRHVDFFGLPRARSTIKIYTLAGDLVAQLDHDGTRGDGQAPWNLISRHGQDVESGIYLFTVDSPLGHQVGRFVIIR